MNPSPELRGYLVPLIAGLVLIYIGLNRAHGAELHVPIDCEQVRTHVAQYGRVKAIAWAWGNGFTLAQIKEAEKCLKPSFGASAPKG